MSVTHFYETHAVDPRYNLAFEEYLLKNKLEGSVLMLWQNDNAVIIGMNQNTAQEINEAFVKEHNIRVVRRTTGGGAVYHDLGNLNYSFIADAGNAEQLVIAQFALPVVRALKGLGLDAEASGRNDILVAGQKVSGTAQRLHKGRLLFHGTLLFDTSADMIAGALNADPLKFTSKASASVRSRVGNIRSLLKEDMTLDAFRDYLKQSFAEGGLVQETLTPEELAGVEALRKEKYDAWAWNYGHSPAYDYANKARFDGGIVDARVKVAKGGVIEDVVFYGDFLATQDMTPLTDALKGVPFRREDVAEVLRTFPHSRYFGGVTEEEILSLLFQV